MLFFGASENEQLTVGDGDLGWVTLGRQRLLCRTGEAGACVPQGKRKHLGACVVHSQLTMSVLTQATNHKVCIIVLFEFCLRTAQISDMNRDMNKACVLWTSSSIARTPQWLWEIEERKQLVVLVDVGF
jgi:hypothetical protein